MPKMLMPKTPTTNVIVEKKRKKHFTLLETDFKIKKNIHLYSNVYLYQCTDITLFQLEVSATQQSWCV